MTAAQLNPHEVTDKAEIRDVLLEDAVANAYMLGDLDDAYRDVCRWYTAGVNGAVDGVLLVYDGLSVPAILASGTSEAISAILGRFVDVLPGRALVHLQANHVEPVDQHFACEGLVPALRLGLRSGQLLPYRPEQVALDTEWSLEVLSHRDTGQLFSLYRFYPDNFFEPAQLSTGHYYGVRAEGRLVSVAGVHVFSPELGVACLGNIVTHPDYRGHGLSSLCTSHLCTELIAAGIDVLALNVERHNRSAMRVYERLGFFHHCTYVEGLVTRGINEQIAPA